MDNERNKACTYLIRLKDVSRDCEKALEQVDARAYAANFEEEYSQVICYVVSFFKKRCLLHLKK